MNKKNCILGGFITLLIGCVIFYIGLNIKSFENPHDIYMVYFNGDKVGLIEDKNELLEKINKEQTSLKEKYNVTNVYPPEGLEIVKYTTYHNNYIPVDEIYNKINDFSIKGYIVTIKNTEENTEKKLYVLNKKDLTNALDKLVSIFVPTDKYEAYLNNTQKEIVDTGEYIQNVYLQETVTIKEGFISTSNVILKSYEEISQYLLYGTLDKQKTYIVKKGDTIESIAYDNGLSTAEFLIANPDLKDEKVLLSGNGDQPVNIGNISPLVNVIYESDLVEEQIDAYNTIVKYDPQMVAGSSYEKQQGENGVIKVKFKMQYLNGEVYQVVKISSTELTPAIDKIIVRGGNKVTGIGGGSGTWYWPTIKPYKITSQWGWRWSSFHEAIDISGCGYGSPIYAAGDGVVIYAGTTSDGAKTVRIDHQNGYYTYYVHLKDYYVKAGQVVNAGTLIAAMGNTGYVIPKPTPSNPTAGTHLHFAVYYSSDGGVSKKNINPLSLKFQ